MTNLPKGAPCPVCDFPLSVRPSRGRKSGKPFIMVICPVSGKHFRAFIGDQQYLREVMDKVGESMFQVRAREK